MFKIIKTRFFWGGFVLAVIFLFSSNFTSVSASQVFPRDDVTISNPYETVYWDIVPQGTAVTAGELSFSVRGITDSDGDLNRLHLFGMVDKGQGLDQNDRTYFVQVRRNISEYRNRLGQATIKGNFDCIWFEELSSRAHQHPWDPEVTYSVRFSWDASQASLLITGGDGLYLSVESSLPKKFAPVQHSVFFGNPPSSAGYYGVPATYSDIRLEAYTIESSVPFSGERCLVEDDDQDDPNNPYDTCSCHAIPDLNAKPPCEDVLDRSNPSELRVLKSNFPFDFSFGGVRINWLWTLDDLVKEAQVKNEQTLSLPEVDLEFVPSSLMPGQINSFLALPTNYRTRIQNMYYGWCAIIDGVTFPMNSIAAGGQSLPELTSPNMTWSDGACCQPITRIPPDEYDYKGMDIRWLEKHFVGRTINGFTYTHYTQVDPNDDPDNDGYFANTFRNEKGEYMTVSPYLVDKYGNKYNPGAEGRLTNIMEYILDTDPLSGDTDGDGYSDGMAFIGVGQMQLDFMAEKLAGPDGYYDISVAVLGTNEAKKVSISGVKKRAFVSSGGKLEINLSADRKIMTFDDSQSLKISTTIVSGEENVEDLSYEWFFNDESLCDSANPGLAEMCDIGQYEIVLGGGISFFDLPEPTGPNYPISLRVTSSATRGVAETIINMPVAMPVSLVTADCGGQIIEIENLAAGTKSPVAVCISEIEELAVAANLSNLNFIWEVDGKTDINQSGAGKSEYMLLPTKLPEDKHNLVVTVKDKDTGLFIANGERTFTIAGPEVKIVSPKTESNNQGSGDKYRFAVFPVGSVVNFRSELRNFVGLGSYEVRWSVDGDIKDIQVIEDAETSFTFEIPGDLPEGKSLNVVLTVQSLDLNVNEQGMDSISILIGVPDGSTGGIASIVGNLAAVFTKIPEAFLELIKYAAIVAVLFFGLVYFYPKLSRFLDN